VLWKIWCWTGDENIEQRPEVEPKILLTDVAKILLWSRRGQWKDKILNREKEGV